MSAGEIEVILFRLQALDKKMDEMRAEAKEARTDLETRLRTLEALRDQAQGVGTAAKAIWAFIGAGGIGVLYAAMQLIQHSAK